MVTQLIIRHCFQIWAQLSHVLTHGHTCQILVTLDLCGQTHHLRSHNSHVVEFFTCRSDLLHVVRLVTCGQTCHMCSHLSHVITLVTCGHIFHICQKLPKKSKTEIMKKMKKSAVIDLMAYAKGKTWLTCTISMSGGTSQGI